MRCPSCDKDVEVSCQDPDFSKYEVEGKTAILELTEKVRCGECYVELARNRWRVEQDISKQGAGHFGKGHELALHPSYFTKSDEGMDVEVRLVCSCGQLDTTFVGTADPVEVSPESCAGSPTDATI